MASIELPDLAYIDALHLILQQFAALIQGNNLLEERTMCMIFALKRLGKLIVPASEHIFYVRSLSF